MVNSKPLESLDLTQLIAAYREKSETCARTSYPGAKWNRASRAIFPIADEVQRRGDEALQALLPLLEHEEEWVRFFAARDCYSTAPQKCRDVLLMIFDDVKAASTAALSILMKNDPAFEGYFMAFMRASGLPAERARAAKESTGYPTASPR